MNTQTYLSICARIRAKAPIVKDIDLYNAQYTDDNAKREDAFNTPAVFIEFLGGQWEQMHPTFQAHNSGFVIHVVESTYKRTRNLDKKSPTQQALDLEHLRTAQKVHESLQRWMPDGCQSVMERVDTDYDHNYDQLIITKHTYHCVVLEEKVVSQYQEVLITSVQVDGKFE
jgi:phage gp37-like protein